MSKPLSAEWQKVWSEEHKEYYYRHLITDVTQWEHPDPPPPPRFRPTDQTFLVRLKAGRGTPRIHHLFSGPMEREDGCGVAAYCKPKGIGCFEFDIVNNTDGCDYNVLHNREFILAGIRDGSVQAAIIGTPCHTFCVARFRSEDLNDGGARPVRDRTHILGRPGLTAEQQAAVVSHAAARTLH